MKIRGEFIGVNLATGERLELVVGDGEVRVVPVWHIPEPPAPAGEEPSEAHQETFQRMPTLDEAERFIKSNLLTTAEALKELWGLYLVTKEGASPFQAARDAKHVTVDFAAAVQQARLEEHELTCARCNCCEACKAKCSRRAALERPAEGQTKEKR